MRLSATLSTYFGRQFLSAVLGTFFAIMAVVFLLDLIELLRRGANREVAGFGVLLQMAFLKAPQMAQKILPFAVLFGGMFAFFRMTKTHELVVARASGVSAWQFLLPAVIVAASLGVVKMAVFTPVTSVMSAKFEQLENKVLRNRQNFLEVSEAGLWVREKSPGGHSILHARGLANKAGALSEISVFLFEGADQFAGRVDADTAILKPGHWRLENAVSHGVDGLPKKHETYGLPTGLTMANIHDSFAAPETLSFWELPAFISILENAGFSAVRHRLYWHSLLASPLLLCAMVLIAATFSLKLTRRGGALKSVSGALFFGFLLYFLSDLVSALALSARIPEILAAWIPSTVTTLLGVTSILHLEDG
jgi:lipopolysaccharide export system permease protein